MLPIVFLLGFVTSLYAVNVGGGGLIIIPTLIFLGFSPHEAVATGLLGYWGLNIVGIYKFNGAKKINWKIGIIGAAIISMGSLSGSFLMIRIPVTFFEKLIGFFLIIILIILLLSREGLGIRKRELSKLKNYIGYSLFLPLGIYAAIVGAGGAILASYILVFFFGLTFLESSGTRKVTLFVNAFVLVISYGFHGIINWPVGFALFVGNAIGAYIGSSFAISKGDKYMRVLLIAMTVVSAVILVM